MDEIIKNLLKFNSRSYSLKETSKDNNSKQVLSEIETSVINFDKVKENYIKSLNLSNQDIAACSVDAIAILEDNLIFIEFKNGGVKSKELRFKIKDSLLIFCDISKTHIEFTRKSVDLYVVYNKDKLYEGKKCSKPTIDISESRDELRTSITKAAGEKDILFDLGRFKGLYFRDVHTYTKEEFEKIAKNITPISAISDNVR